MSESVDELGVPRALLVDDDEDVRLTMRAILEDEGIDVVEAGGGAEAMDAIAASPPHVVISDLRMPGINGIELLARIRKVPDPPRVIVVTGHGSEREAVEAMKRGAYDYLRKPCEVDELLAVIRRAVESASLSRENERLASELLMSRFLVFTSAEMSRLAVLVQRVSPTDATVLIEGESGTGKERIAECIVRASTRAGQPFVRFSCAALTDSLADAELFGFVRGAFTGAEETRLGLVRQAEGGTLLLDQIDELPPSTQAKLVRFLERREVRAVGATEAVPVDVRVIAITQRGLAQRVREGAFREDLYYRLRVVELVVPPLRSRPEDVPLLVDYFFSQFEERYQTGAVNVPDAVRARLVSHAWPGNVRELQNTVENMVALSRGGQLGATELQEAIDEAAPRATLKQKTEAFERGVIVATLTEVGGSRTEAAKVLGISRATLHEKLKRYGIRS